MTGETHFVHMPLTQAAGLGVRALVMGAWERVVVCMAQAVEQRRAGEEAFARADAYSAMARAIARNEVVERRGGVGASPAGRRGRDGGGRGGEGDER